MQCPNCGSFMADDAKFCTSCGTTLQYAQAQYTPQQQPYYGQANQQFQQPQPPAPKKGLGKIIAIVAIALILAGGIGFGVYAYLNHLGPFADNASSGSAESTEADSESATSSKSGVRKTKEKTSSASAASSSTSSSASASASSAAASSSAASSTSSASASASSAAASSAAASSASASASSAASGPKLVKAGTLTVGVSPDYPPYEYKENDKSVGFDIELIEAIANKIGLKVEIVEINYDSIISAVQSGKVDIAISAINVTEERSKLVAFSTTYLIDPENGDELAIAIGKDNPELTAAINKAIDELKKDGTIDKLAEKYGI